MSANEKEFRFILFDIDHTLIDSGGAGIVGLNKALEDVTGISNGFDGINCAGKTDVQILREAASKFSLALDHGMMPRILNRYLVYLRDAMLARNGRVKPGVYDLLERLDLEKKFESGLLTGNVEQGARIKLEPFSLNRFFPVGAFGDDSEDRNQLLPIAVERLSLVKGLCADYVNCVVVGDTPRDVDCAKAHGAASIAVATGPFDIKTLKKTGADLVLADLSDTDYIVNWMGSF